MLIYTKHRSKRLEYVLDLALKRMMGLEYAIVSDQSEIVNKKSALINYSLDDIANSFTIHPHNLLFEEVIMEQNVHFHYSFDNLPLIFETERGDLPFDIFAAIFYLVTRYEEYLPFEPDKYGRFPASSSLAYKHDILQMPLVNLWIESFKKKLLILFPDLKFKILSFEYIPSIDIDLPWAFIHKSLPRSAGGLFKDLIRADVNKAKYRLKVISGKIKDPFDTYSEWDAIHGDLSSRLRVFILAGRKSGYDLKVSTSNKSWRNLLKFLSSKYQTGLHPSYNSDLDNSYISKEKNLVESLAAYSISRSRQHFLKISFPDTYRRLIKAGIKEDYSMGYPDQAGFRAGIAYPFPFFDLEHNVSTELIIYPFCVMDRTLKDYMGLKPADAIKVIDNLLNSVKELKGLFVSVWHNDSLGNYGEWEGWKDVYLHMINMLTIKNDAKVS